MDINFRKDLYSKFEKPNKLNSKLNEKIKESDNIQIIHQWLRKIEDASESAINKALIPSTENNTIKRSKSNFTLNDKKKLTDIQDHINKKVDPHSDAHDLITEWITDKIRFDLDDDFFDYVNISEVNKFSNNEKYLNDLKAELMETDLNQSILDIKGIDYDKYDENYIAKDILNKIMKKKVVDPKKLLYSDTNKQKVIDTQLKIEMRHKAVKENREKRAKEMELKRQEKLDRKEIEFQARQMVLKEENEKKMKENLEKQLIEQEAQKLRIEMAEKRIKEEEIRKQKRELDRLRKERDDKELYEIQKKCELVGSDNILQEKRNEMAEKRANDLVESFLKVKKLRTLQKCFSIWYGSILESRIKNGKAKALADWKISYKVFNGWKKMVLVEKIRKNQEIHQNEIRENNLKNNKAAEFYKKTLLFKVFNAWQKHVMNELLLKKLNEEKTNVKNRMQRFLEAAKEEKSNNLDIDLDELHTKRSETSKNLSNLSTKRYDSVDNLTNTNRSNSRIRSANIRNNKANSNRSKNNDDQYEDEEFKAFINKKQDFNFDKKVKDMMQPWLKSPTVKIFDNRFKAQEKMLNEQSKMIKEQQKLIEDLKYQQSQMAFKEQISLLEEIKTRQIELEKLQKAQFAQEKKILREQAQSKKETPRTERETLNENENIDNTHFQLNKNDETEDISKKTNFLQEKKFDKIAILMEERAKNREKLKKEREEKKRKMEQEKLDILKAQQEEKLRVEEEEKRKKAEELREKNAARKFVEEKKAIELQKEKELIQKADEFYRKHLLRYYCLGGFKKLIEAQNLKNEKATKHHNKKIFGIIFTEWRTLIKASVIVKQRKADEFYNRILLKNTYFNGIKQFKQSLQICNAKAIRFYNYNIKIKLYGYWKVYVSLEKEKSRNYELMITEHNMLRIKTIYFTTWKNFPNEMKKERARQKRLDELRNKVKQLIPDYLSPDSTNQI
ncbi:unnamed protein product [Brachionus calyciflorus]|uniref:Uncharacterized protein n=1 Tax=Brachionus calyciflorus TaxID=104777 RepID=A0A813TYP9_9BILA|nr:unnamed protein product [Brachionus calyciflorus]